MKFYGTCIRCRERILFFQKKGMAPLWVHITPGIKNHPAYWVAQTDPIEKRFLRFSINGQFGLADGRISTVGHFKTPALIPDAQISSLTL